ncbi:MAG: DUF4405 domain-containing protein [Bacteroidales bacterium]|nr:DUF4405 domain-containing protein [Bacteroidales bacterium]
MKKNKLNFIINALLFFCMASMAGIGFLMKYILISGQERWVKYGSNVDILLFNMDRHKWGTIHLIIGFVMLGLLVLHIILHWKVILCMYHRLIKWKMARKIIASMFIITCTLLIVLPFIIKPQIKEVKQGEGRKKTEQNRVSEKKESNNSNRINHNVNTSIEVKGYMTLGEVSGKYNVPSEYLKEKLKIPKSVSDKQKLGWLRKKYNFRMSNVENAISEYKKNE